MLSATLVVKAGDGLISCLFSVIAAIMHAATNKAPSFFFLPVVRDRRCRCSGQSSLGFGQSLPDVFAAVFFVFLLITFAVPVRHILEVQFVISRSSIRFLKSQ
jgi:hypothetical protein